MKLHTLKPAEGSVHKEKRIGRGEASGKGGTSTQGNKGSQQRAGYQRKNAFEGGQMPIQRRLPKFGFKNVNRVEYKAINIETLEALALSAKLSKIGLSELREAGFLSKTALVKILGKGVLTTKIDVEANAFSKSAEEAIVAAGGTVVKL